MNSRVKYPRTYHLPFSAGLQADDKKIKSLQAFEGQEVVVNLKMDGENTTIYPDSYLHARSLDSKGNWTQDIAKQIASGIGYLIPEGHRLCCENLTARHAIYYPDNYLEGYVYLLSVWNKENMCLSWDDTVDIANMLDLPQPKTLYRGIFDIKSLQSLAKDLDTSIEEGFVVRTTSAFHYKDFEKHVTKYVRQGHVQDNAEHWLKTATPNGIPMSPGKPAFMSFRKNKIKM